MRKKELIGLALLLLTAAPAAAQTNDPMLSSQWAINSLNLPAAWDVVKGHANICAVDVGVEVNHPDLRAFPIGNTSQYDGGNLRLHLSYDFHGSTDDACPDEFDESGNVVSDAPCNGQPLTNPVGPEGNQSAGHGTHVSGIIAATTDNGLGVAGACQHCSLMMAQMRTSSQDLPPAIFWGLDRGAQVISGSLGVDETFGAVSCPPLPGQNPAWNPLCDALDLADQTDVVLVFAAGNDLGPIDFPARYPGAIAVGGIEQDGSVWSRNDDFGEHCPSFYDPAHFSGTTECGSNSGPELDLVAPAENVLSTVYTEKQWIVGAPGIEPCGDGSTLDGFGVCTGTSMSAPYVAGIAGLVRSANPLLSKQNVYSILTQTADHASSWTPTLGYGEPNAGLAVDAALGLAPGRQLANRLTPLFSLYSEQTEDYLYTTVPQVASSAVRGFLHTNCTTDQRQNCALLQYSSAGPPVPYYDTFPGVPQIGPVPDEPAASVYVFTGDAAPYPGAPPLVPLYRLTFKGPNPNGNPNHRDTAYAVSTTEILHFHDVDSNGIADYELDGIEGYIFPRCTPEPACMPPGTVRLFRRYHPQRDDFAIFPESELAAMAAQGYTSTGGEAEVIGYVYPNLDSDFDGVIDGFESLIGTNPNRADSDCDGVSDGAEILNYPYNDPLGSPGCVPPVARFTFNCSGLGCTFDGSGSTDNIGIVSYTWTFGDATGAFGATPSHAFAATGSYTVTLTVTDGDGLQSSLSRKVSVTSETPASAESYFTVSPCRVVDTHTTTALTSGVLRTFQITGQCGIPATADAVAVNLTADTPTGSGNLVFYPGNQTSGPFLQAAITFNVATAPRSNNGILRLATTGAGTLTVNPTVFATPGTVHLTLDVDGYFSRDATPAPGAQGPFGFQTVTPCRIADTRTSTPIAANTSRSFTVQGVCGVPAGAAAAALNPLVFQPTADGQATVFPAGAPSSLRTINFKSGVILANGAKVALAAGTPDVSLSYTSSTAGASTHAVIDVFGYFKADAPLRYRPITACRAVDTRFGDQGGPAMAADEVRSFQIRGNCGVPLTAKAVALNIVAFAPAGTGHLKAYRSDIALPAASYLNFNAVQANLGNGGIVGLSSLANDLTIQSAFSSTNVIIDVFGYFE